MRARSKESFGFPSRDLGWSEGEVEAGRGVLEERQVRDDEAVAGAAEEDPDERQRQAEGAEHREEDDRRLPLRRSGRRQIPSVDVRDEPRADEDEERRQHARDGRVEVSQQLLEAEEVP